MKKLKFHDTRCELLFDSILEVQSKYLAANSLEAYQVQALLILADSMSSIAERLDKIEVTFERHGCGHS